MVDAMTEIHWSVTFGPYLKGFERHFILPSAVLGTADSVLHSIPAEVLAVGTSSVEGRPAGEDLVCQDRNKGA